MFENLSDNITPQIMATSKSTLDYFLELLSDIPDLHAKAMFGEYGIYS